MSRQQLWDELSRIMGVAPSRILAARQATGKAGFRELKRPGATPPSDALPFNVREVSLAVLGYAASPVVNRIPDALPVLNRMRPMIWRGTGRDQELAFGFADGDGIRDPFTAFARLCEHQARTHPQDCGVWVEVDETKRVSFRHENGATCVFADSQDDTGSVYRVVILEQPIFSFIGHAFARTSIPV